VARYNELKARSGILVGVSSWTLTFIKREDDTRS
jgi:hypothetical protein